jgi:hypothetical protein
MVGRSGVDLRAQQFVVAHQPLDRVQHAGVVQVLAEGVPPSGCSPSSPTRATARPTPRRRTAGERHHGRRPGPDGPTGPVREVAARLDAEQADADRVRVRQQLHAAFEATKHRHPGTGADLGSRLWCGGFGEVEINDFLITSTTSGAGAPVATRGCGQACWTARTTTSASSNAPTGGTGSSSPAAPPAGTRGASRRLARHQRRLPRAAASHLPLPRLHTRRPPLTSRRPCPACGAVTPSPQALPVATRPASSQRPEPTQTRPGGPWPQIGATVHSRCRVSL